MVLCLCVAPYRYLFPNMYLSVVNIANPDFLGCCRTWISLDIACFCEEQCPKNGKSEPLLGTGGADPISTADY